METQTTWKQSGAVGAEACKKKTGSHCCTVTGGAEEKLSTAFQASESISLSRACVLLTDSDQSQQVRISSWRRTAVCICFEAVSSFRRVTRPTNVSYYLGKQNIPRLHLVSDKISQAAFKWKANAAIVLRWGHETQPLPPLLRVFSYQPTAWPFDIWFWKRVNIPNVIV